jgi:hypothetical protein
MDNGVLLETKTFVELIRHYTSGTRCAYFPYFTPASGIRNSKISRHFHCCCFENTNGLCFVYKTKLTLEIKRKHLKRHVEISKIYSSFMFALKFKKNIAFILVFCVLIYMSSLCVFLSLWISPYNKQNIKQLRKDMDLCSRVKNNISLVRWYCFCHSNIKSISSRSRLISSILSQRKGFTQICMWVVIRKIWTMLLYFIWLNLNSGFDG